MKILESWGEVEDKCFAIVRYSKKEQKEFKIKKYEALWLDDGELNSFAGTVGFRIADFDRISKAKEFLLKGIELENTNPDIWWEMLEV